MAGVTESCVWIGTLVNHRTLLVTSEMPAGLGYPTAGGGLRAWNIAEGLRQRGFEVAYALMQPVVEGKTLPEDYLLHVWTPETLNRVIFEAAPEVLIFCQWHPMTFLEKAPCPVVVDLFGLLLLENWFRGVGEIQLQAQAKLRTLAKADAFLVTSPTLKAYFTAWLTMSGVSPDDFPLLDVPISLPDRLPPLPSKREHSDLRFVYSGIFWPWQNPLLPLKTLVEAIRDAGKGKLIIYGGKHPIHQVPGESTAKFLTELEQSPQVEIRGLVPHEELMAGFSELDVAVDAMELNIERELSSPIRSICYLWAGLPPVVSDYLYLAKDLEQSDAGWCVNPDNASALRSLFDRLLSNPEEVFDRRVRAQEFARRRHTWSVALNSLADFCASPRYRKKGRHLLDTTLDCLQTQQTEIERLHEEMKSLQESYHRERVEWAQQRDEWIRRKDDLEARLHRAEHDLEAIRSKFLFRFFKRIKDLVAPERKPDQ